ncbi:MAG: hypothetical protein ABSF09_01100 [Candidatus Bathyarchaeia archaeon]
MKVQRIAIVLLIFLIAVNLPSPELPLTHAIGVANVVVTNVFWGTDPMNPQTAVHAGDVNAQLSIIISNVGDDVARDVSGTLYLTPPIDYTYFVNGVQNRATSVTKVAGDMNPATPFTLNWVVNIESTARNGIYHCNLTLSYKSARELQQINKTVQVDIPIYQGALYIQAVATTPVKLFPDSYGNQVTVTLANSGTGIAKNVQVYLQLKSPFVPSSSGSAEIFLGNLPTGQTTNANFVVDVAENATFGQYSILLNQVLNNTLVPIGQVPLYIAEKVVFGILSVTPSVINPGASGSVIRVRIKNLSNTTKAESVRVELQVGNYITGTLTDFLGDMSAGQLKTAIFTIDVDSREPTGNYPIGIRFDWTQANNQFSLDHTYPVTLSVQPGPLPLPLLIIPIIAIIGIVYFAIKKKILKIPQRPKK